MQRNPWFEVHDHPIFPRFLRRLVTDALEAIWNATDLYSPITPRLKRALEDSHTRGVIDLCSGGGGPWFRLQPALAAAGCSISVVLTDKYPNQPAFDMASLRSLQAITGYEKPVDASCPPHDLNGFRTMFSSFHHFDPKDARAILTDCFDRDEGSVTTTAPRKNRTKQTPERTPSAGTANNPACPAKNEFSWGSRRNTIAPATNEDWKTYVLFERTNLLTDCGLRTINPLGSLREVLSFIDGKQVFKMAKLYGI
jgi:hypothetical protein